MFAMLMTNVFSHVFSFCEIPENLLIDSLTFVAEIISGSIFESVYKFNICDASFLS